MKKKVMILLFLGIFILSLGVVSAGENVTTSETVEDVAVINETIVEDVIVINETVEDVAVINETVEDVTVINETVEGVTVINKTVEKTTTEEETNTTVEESAAVTCSSHSECDGGYKCNKRADLPFCLDSCIKDQQCKQMAGYRCNLDINECEISGSTGAGYGAPGEMPSFLSNLWATITFWN